MGKRQSWLVSVIGGLRDTSKTSSSVTIISNPAETRTEYLPNRTVRTY
jgi:hypothetical protein